MVDAPPLSKRLTALTAFVSLLASVIVLIIAIPKGIDEYTEDSSENVSTTIAPVKAANISSVLFTAKGDGVETSALSVGNDLWIVASDKLSSSRDITVQSLSGSESVAREVAKLSSSGISVLRCISSCIQEGTVDPLYLSDPQEIDDVHDLRVVDAFTTHAIQAAPSVAMVQQTSDSPIHVEDAINGVAVAIDPQNHVVGIVIRKNHSNWLLGKKNLTALSEWVSRN